MLGIAISGFESLEDDIGDFIVEDDIKEDNEVIIDTDNEPELIEDDEDDDDDLVTGTYNIEDDSVIGD